MQTLLVRRPGQVLRAGRLADVPPADVVRVGLRGRENVFGDMVVPRGEARGAAYRGAGFCAYVTGLLTFRLVLFSRFRMWVCSVKCFRVGVVRVWFRRVF